jgi:hypothetical protein
MRTWNFVLLVLIIQSSSIFRRDAMHFRFQGHDFLDRGQRKFERHEAFHIPKSKCRQPRISKGGPFRPYALPFRTRKGGAEALQSHWNIPICYANSETREARRNREKNFVSACDDMIGYASQSIITVHLSDHVLVPLSILYFDVETEVAVETAKFASRRISLFSCL